MTKWLRIAISSAGMAAWVWLVFSFMAWELDAGQWSWGVRCLAVIGWMLSSCVAAFGVVIGDDEEAA